MCELLVRRPEANPRSTSLDVLARLGAARLESSGIDWRPLAAAHDLTIEDEPVEDIRISTAREHAFLETAALASRDPLFAWKLGDMSVKSFGLAGYAILNAATVADALDTFAGLMPTVCEAIHLDTIVDGDTATLAYVSSDARQNSVFGLRFILNVLRELIGPQFAATRLGLAAAEQNHLPSLSRQVAAPLTAELPFTFATFPARYLRARVDGADARLAETLRPYWQRDRAAAQGRPAVVRSRIEGAIVQSLHDGLPSQAQIAEILGIGRAGVETEMGRLGGYRAVVDGVRRRLAEEFVQRTDMKMAAIAAVLGYSEPGALNHAYRRWTGRTPTADRRRRPLPSDAPDPANANRPLDLSPPLYPAMEARRIAL